MLYQPNNSVPVANGRAAPRVSDDQTALGPILRETHRQNEVLRGFIDNIGALQLRLHGPMLKAVRGGDPVIDQTKPPSGMLAEIHGAQAITNDLLVELGQELGALDTLA